MLVARAALCTLYMSLCLTLPMACKCIMLGAGSVMTDGAALQLSQADLHASLHDASHIVSEIFAPMSVRHEGICDIKSRLVILDVFLCTTGKIWA